MLESSEVARFAAPVYESATLMGNDEQIKDLERLQRHIERNGLACHMNDTRWRAAIRALLGVSDYRPAFRVRCVRDTSEPNEHWDRSFPEHVPTFVQIEWLEVCRTTSSQPSHDVSEQIISALQAAHVPFVERDDAIRIIGYTRHTVP
jgi:hypothetical protein